MQPGEFSWALESAYLEHRRKSLLAMIPDGAPSPDAERWQSQLSRLLDLSGVTTQVRRAINDVYFASPREFVQWLLPVLPVLDSPSLTILGEILSNLTQTSIRLLPASDMDSAGSWNTWNHTVQLDGVRLQPKQTGELSQLLKDNQYPRVEAVLRLSPQSDEANYRHILLDVLDWLSETTASGSIEPAIADRILDALRTMADGLHWVITPAFWTYTDEWNHKHFDEATINGAIFNFNPSQPLGAVTGVPRFGMATADSTIRETSVAISLGPVIEEIRECIQLGLQTSPASLEPLRQEIRQWARHMLNGTLRDELTDFYVRLHETSGATWQRSDEAGFSRFRDSLHDVLRSQFGIHPFLPTRRDEYQRHWIVVVGNTAAQTGRVRRVLQPGLLDSQDRLIVPARVEVE